ncbi:M13 family metallopeptidase [Massilia sp. CMS3.1]|uniref:M13 family metallopeptidase n=1 Tax=Massilia sp. CMS3.1 TaxID=3373083 RepID=UPI003EE4AAB8
MTLRPFRLACLLVPFLLLPAAADPGVRPQDDLYLAANGAWLARTTIPADKSEVYGADLPAIVNARVRGLVDGLRRQPRAPGSVERKLIDYHDSYLDTEAIDSAGLAPLLPLLAEVDAVKDHAALARWQGSIQGVFKTPLWFWGGFADFKDPTLNRALLMQGGLGLPDRDYYLKNEERMLQARTAYLEYLTTLARFAGDPAPAQSARAVLALETKLAAAHLPVSEAMNPAQVRSLDAARLGRDAPGLDWRAFLLGAGFPDSAVVNVVQPPAAVASARLMAELPLADWKAYFRLRLIDAMAQVLPGAVRDAHFAFHGKAISGQSRPAPRAERAIDNLTDAVGDGLSAMYMARYFPPAQKARVERMAARILAAAQEAAGRIAWMSPATRREARAKIARSTMRVGYPARWRDYSALEIRPGDAFGNRMRARRHEWLRLAALSGTPVDRGLWTMSPLEANAYYDPVLNEINLPAGILQAPFFDAQASDAANYGGIGALIGHEISHAFDTTGSQFDSRGAQRDWWTAADHAAFKAFGRELAARFDAEEVLPGVHVNGKLTLSENIADLMGLQLAWRAFKGEARAGDSREFFLAYARQWAVKRRDERVLQLLASDQHAPGALRANFPAMQLDAFHDTYTTRPGERMYLAPEARLRAW